MLTSCFLTTTNFVLLDCFHYSTIGAVCKPESSIVLVSSFKTRNNRSIVL
nr:MAG TPA: hypothetical protein [Caudoviricetes sp.]